ncbi:NUDIX hydrolase [Naasia lichenicola]|uniref:NUDIX domain-containing protein n=1 Tax=Naasia lichenicola TaxID=2565933 RepID=A0A4V3WTE6_9MICO|nr:NUDIX domain-containing protein [Naasia lichenicola]THG31607.1 NUDIX domain-containing protein [Naasia lichenicola]
MAQPVVVSAVVFRDDEGRVLTVRKQGTSSFMFPGGKPEPGEDAVAAAVRECHEELGAVLDPDALVLVGVFDARAANEDGRIVATVFEHPPVRGGYAPHGEIAELAWSRLDDRTVAPLLRDHVFPALELQGSTSLSVTTESAGDRRPDTLLE